MSVSTEPAASPPSPPAGRRSLLLNYVLYQVGWLACVAGAAAGRPWTGAAIATVMLALHLAWVRQPATEALLVVAACVAGVAIDSALPAAGLYRFAGGHLVDWLAPAWIILLWAQFATTLRFTLVWLGRNLPRAAILGAVGGPLGFWAGERLGAVTFTPPSAAGLVALGVAWAIATPLLAGLAHRLGPAPAYRGLGTPRR